MRAPASVSLSVGEGVWRDFCLQHVEMPLPGEDVQEAEEECSWILDYPLLG